MGFNTTVLILNDAWDQIRKNPEEFVEGIYEKMNYGGTVGVGNHANPVQVIESRHADEFRLYASHGNQITELSPWSKETQETMRRFPDHVRSNISQARFFLDQLEKVLDEASTTGDT